LSQTDVALPPLAIEKDPSGLLLIAIQRRGLPLFHVRLSLPAGASEDPGGRRGSRASRSICSGAARGAGPPPTSTR
jgi:hypothetical protein